MLSAAHMARMSRLLKEALELDPARWQRWLEALPVEDQDLEPALRRALLPEADKASFFEASVMPRSLSVGLQNWTFGTGLQPGETVGPYQLVRPLGTGGMAEVWLAQRADGAFKRQVALKLPMLFRLRKDLASRFERERDILAALVHPNIARLYDAGVSRDGLPYLAMEYVVGTPFTTYCDDHRLSIRVRLELFQQVLSAVRYAHANLVIHRDIKPSNILVTEGGQVQLLDFGIAKILSEGVAKETQLTQLAGRALTPDYAAPEQIAGASITTAADVYALGVVLYELLTGERPYRLKRESLGALEEAILQTEPRSPSRVAQTETSAQARATTTTKLPKVLRGDLDAITMKALRKSPEARYGTASEFAEDIVRFLRGQVVLAQPDSVAYRFLKFAGRHRVAIAGISILIFTLAGGFATTSYEAKVASAQRDVALQAQLRSLTQTAAARLKDGDVSGALAIILEVLPHWGVERVYTSEALNVFHEARAADLQALTITGLTGPVRRAAFSQDGKQVVTSSWDKTARVWDTATGREIRLLSGHTAEVESAAFSPDGRLIVTASADKTARIWDAVTGRQVLLLSGHADAVITAAFSPNGQQIVTASWDKAARIWDAMTGRQVRLLSGHTGRVYSAAFSPDGKQIVTASWDKTARIWDVATGRQMVLLSGHTEPAYSAAFSPDSKQIVTASRDKTSRVWDAATGRQLLLLSGHTSTVVSAAFSPDGKQIVTASADKTARIWDTATGQQVLLLSGHTDWVYSAAFSPDGKQIVTASVDKTARIWDIATRRQVLLLNGCIGAEFSPDGKQIEASLDKTVQIRDAATGRQVRLLSGHTDRVEDAEFSPDGRQILTASLDKTARVWDAATGRQVRLLSGHTDFVNSAAFSRDGKQIVTGSADKTARVWDTATGQQMRVLSGHTDRVLSAEFSPGGKQIVTGSADKTARIWDTATGRQVLLLNGHTDPVRYAEFSPDGKQIVTASEDKTARIWEVATGQQVLLLSGHTDFLNSAVFSADGKQIVTASADKTARVWDAATGRQLLLLSGHTSEVISAAFSPDGKLILTGSGDETVRTWDAHVSALNTQIEWAEAAQFDPLPATERFQLGLPAPNDVRLWSARASKCDRAAGAPYDPDRRDSGIMLDQMVPEIALQDCTKSDSDPNTRARSTYQHGRAAMANGDFSGAKRDFEAALAARYRSAQVDLGMLLSQPSAQMLDVPRAIRLYEQAWKDGVTIAAFELGSLYEHGVSPAGKSEYALAPDLSRAWLWYQKAADRGEPNALARIAQKYDAAASSEEGIAQRDSDLLSSFRYYAAAAERARYEVWPADAWRNWRYHRASLARLLARDGLMPQVAGVYDAVLKEYAPPPATIFNRLTSNIGID